MEMPRSERRWYVERLKKQYEYEKAEIDKVSHKK